jgi:hypothetical protein
MTRFSVRPWNDIESFYAGLLEGGATFVEPLLRLTRSIITEGASEALAAHTSMHDLVVTTTPVSTQPDWLRVSLEPGGKVKIEHEQHTGPGDMIVRDESDALPLFWRFAIEKWGIHPDRDGR